MNIRTILLFAALCMCIVCTHSLYALADGDTPQVITSHFRIFSDFDEEATLEIATQLSQLHDFYNHLFNFHPRPQTGLNVRYFATKSTFDEYLISVVGRTYPHFVFLDYDSVEENELILHPQKEDFESALAHFVFIEFLESNILQPPLWIREGYARYVENIRYRNIKETVIFRENNFWLDPLKNIIRRGLLIDLETFFQMGSEEVAQNSSIFYPQAWGVVNFIISYRARGNDTLAQDIINALSVQSSEEENIRAVMRILSARFKFSELQEQFQRYILDKESNKDLLTTAIEYYDIKETAKAEHAFYDIITLDSNNHVPYYYLGIINYEREDYDSAAHYYIRALAKGAEKGVTYYALGLNSLALGERTAAIAYFDEARELDPNLAARIGAALKFY